MNWRKKRFTFMVIPDANSSVTRFQLSAVTIVVFVALALIVSALLIAGSITWYSLYTAHSGEESRLREQLSDSEKSYKQTLLAKNEQISELQTEVVGLSEQAESIKDRLTDIDSLEIELKTMVGLETASKAASSAKDKNVKISAATAGDDRDGLSAANGTGGEELPVAPADMRRLADETRGHFLKLFQRIEELEPRLESTKTAMSKQLAALRVTPTLWPADSRRVTSTFGIRKDPFTGRATMHAGLDLGGRTGDPVYATADGTVVSADRDSAHGNNIWLKHTSSLRTHYSHLSEMLVEPGDKVRKGDLIGKIGSTGRSTGPHLHYEVQLNGELIDPKPYMQATRKEPA